MPPQSTAFETLPEKEESDRQQIYYEGELYDVTDWIPKHPGGNIINFYTDTNEDSTIPIQQFHHRSIKQVLARMKTFKRSSPPISDLRLSETERHMKMTKDFQALHKSFVEQGVFEPSFVHAFLRVFEIVLFFSLWNYFWMNETIFMARPLSCLFGTIYFIRCAFFIHECGHGSLTGYPKFDKFLEAIIMNLGMGLSSTCWASQHNRHHAMPQRVDRDVDLNTLPLIAFNSKIAFDSKNGNNFFTRNQAFLFFSIDTFLVAVFWKTYLHPKYMIHKKQYGLLFLSMLHNVFMFWQFGPATYALLVWLGSMFIFGTFTLSHSHLDVTTEKLHWVEYSFLHTSNVNPSWWCDWAMGYLNYQVEHHLFPTMPNFRQRQISAQVKAYAEKHGLPYQINSYPAAIEKALKNLADVSHEIKNQKRE